MAYSRPFVKIRINGVFGSTAALGLEKWSTGFNISSLGGGSFDPANLSTFLGNIAPHVSIMHANATLRSGTTTWLTNLTAAYIGVDGLYVLGSLQPTTVFTYVTPVAGAGVAAHPLATSCVISLRSLRLRGPASHGRMYWPATSIAVSGNDMTIAPSNTALIATGAKTFLDSVNGVAASTFGSGGKVSLVSKVGAGAEAIVTSVMVDQKVDHMESRERSISSTYATATTAVALQAIAERDEQLRQAYDELDL